MPVRRVLAHPSAQADQGRVAVQRGPLVYAAEWPDNPGGHVRNLLLPDTSPLTTEFRPDLLRDASRWSGRNRSPSRTTRGGGIERREQEATLIPYYAWANRGAGEMTVGSEP